MADIKPFHQWKEEFRGQESPMVRPRDEYYTMYGRYVLKERAAAPQAPSEQQAEPTDASLWTLQGHRLATSGKAAWACRAFDPDAGEGGSWGEWRLTSYEPPRRPDRWFEVVALPALAGQQSERPAVKEASELESLETGEGDAR